VLQILGLPAQVIHIWTVGKGLHEHTSRTRVRERDERELVFKPHYFLFGVASSLPADLGASPTRAQA
jgi:hypothetical protein